MLILKGLKGLILKGLVTKQLGMVECQINQTSWIKDSHALGAKLIFVLMHYVQ